MMVQYDYDNYLFIIIIMTPFFFVNYNKDFRYLGPTTHSPGI